VCVCGFFFFLLCSNFFTMRRFGGKKKLNLGFTHTQRCLQMTTHLNQIRHTVDTNFHEYLFVCKQTCCLFNNTAVSAHLIRSCLCSTRLHFHRNSQTPCCYPIITNTAHAFTDFKDSTDSSVIKLRSRIADTQRRHGEACRQVLITF
jgi:hypothetical protein